ncbi:MAG: hypothetical protein HY898_00725 [Deltaproteobacteria bacterium]|nr:hypothetical protein [Deltaproteobacteria bacterium]
MSRAFRLCLLLSAAAVTSCGGKALDCGQLPCPDELLIWGDLTYKGSEAVHINVKICRNDKCSSGDVQADPLGHAEVTLQGDLPAVVELASRTASDTWQLSVKVNDSNGTDGDKVTLTLTTVPKGTVIFDKKASSVKYVTSQPNGPECSPTCRSAIVAFD